MIMLVFFVRFELSNHDREIFTVFKILVEDVFLFAIDHPFRMVVK